MSAKIILRCEYCGKSFTRFPSQITVNTRYCSRKCATTGAARDKRGPVQFVDDTVLIPLTRDQIAIVDRDDYESLPELKEPWMAQASGNTFYAWKWIDGIYTYMHVYIVKPESGMEVHHKDNNGLNDRRYNLAELSKSIHKATRIRIKSQGRYTSQYKGVIRENRSTKNPWYARITINGIFYHLGAFPTEEAAATEYDRHALAAFGAFAQLNFPPENKPDE